MIDQPDHASKTENHIFDAVDNPKAITEATTSPAQDSVGCEPFLHSQVAWNCCGHLFVTLANLTHRKSAL